MNHWHRSLKPDRGAWLPFLPQHGTRKTFGTIPRLFCVKEKGKERFANEEGGVFKGAKTHTASRHTHTHSCPIAVITLPDEKCVSAHGSLVLGISTDSSLENARALHLSQWQVSDTGPPWQTNYNSVEGGEGLMALTRGLGNDCIQISSATHKCQTPLTKKDCCHFVCTRCAKEGLRRCSLRWC